MNGCIKRDYFYNLHRWEFTLSKFLMNYFSKIAQGWFLLIIKTYFGCGRPIHTKFIVYFWNLLWLNFIEFSSFRMKIENEFEILLSSLINRNVCYIFHFKEFLKIYMKMPGKSTLSYVSFFYSSQNCEILLKIL